MTALALAVLTFGMGYLAGKLSEVNQKAKSLRAQR